MSDIKMWRYRFSSEAKGPNDFHPLCSVSYPITALVTLTPVQVPVGEKANLNWAPDHLNTNITPTLELHNHQGPRSSAGSKEHFSLSDWRSLSIWSLSGHYCDQSTFCCAGSWILSCAMSKAFWRLAALLWRLTGSPCEWACSSTLAPGPRIYSWPPRSRSLPWTETQRTNHSEHMPRWQTRRKRHKERHKHLFHSLLWCIYTISCHFFSNIAFA